MTAQPRYLLAFYLTTAALLGGYWYLRLREASPIDRMNDLIARFPRP